MTSYLEPLMRIWPNSTGMVPGWSPTKIVQMVLIGWISRSRGQKNRSSNCNFQKSCLKLQGPELSYLVYSIILMSSTKVVQIMPLGSKVTLPRVSQFLHWIIQENLQTTSSFELLMGMLPTSTGMVPVWSPTKIVQMVLIGWISRSRGQKNRSSNCSFQKSCLKLQGPELSYLVYSTI